MLSLQFYKRFLPVFVLTGLLTACATGKTMTVAATASLLEDVAKASYRQSDLSLVRQGMPSYLMLIDGMVEALQRTDGGPGLFVQWHPEAMAEKYPDHMQAIYGYLVKLCVGQNTQNK